MNPRVRLEFSTIVPVFCRVEWNGRDGVEIRELSAVAAKLPVEIPLLSDGILTC